MNKTLLLLLLLSLGCETTDPCTTMRLVNVAPGPDTWNNSPTGLVQGTILHAPESVEVLLNDVVGPVGGALDWDPESGSFAIAPARPLAADRVDVQVSAGACTLGWTYTVAPGQPSSSSLLQHTFRLDPTMAADIEPALLGAYIHDASQVQPTLLLQITQGSADGRHLHAVAAWETGRNIGLPADPDPCIEVAEVPEVFYWGPLFEIESFDWNMVFWDTEFAIDNMSLMGWLNEEGSRVPWARVSGALDLRPMEVAMNASWGDVCAAFANTETPCAPCSADQVEACLPFELAGLAANAIQAPAIDPGFGPQHPACLGNQTQ